ncbi:hypothetical protein [Methyloversatilis thermotolerans]|uniref:hypothetical protein n=1 Tax=Methyloversatilis thermotolerans TaxID=1346290 RepID=UPI00036BD28B|nr:hypothetical protein [Methyloversatilis thermotolerans]
MNIPSPSQRSISTPGAATVRPRPVTPVDATDALEALERDAPSAPEPGGAVQPTGGNDSRRAENLAGALMLSAIRGDFQQSDGEQASTLPEPGSEGDYARLAARRQALEQRYAEPASRAPASADLYA